MKNSIDKTVRKRKNAIGNKDNTEIEKKIFIQTLDMNWRSHLQYLEQLRQVIGLEKLWSKRSTGMNIKKKLLALFENLLKKIKFDVMTILLQSNYSLENTYQKI